jgi:DNA-binding FadR family transcriptional regulator
MVHIMHQVYQASTRARKVGGLQQNLGVSESGVEEALSQIQKTRLCTSRKLKTAVILPLAPPPIVV